MVDTDYMALAFKASETFAGHTWPNPSVGCVLVRDGAVIATGCTQMGGRPHAEIDALAKTKNAHGATAYITLEPCGHAHADKPVSCCDALIAAGIKRVVVAMTDPDPRMAGASLKKLQSAGIDTDILLIPAHAGFVTRLQKGRPRIMLKLAHSADGKIGRAGERINISSDDSWTEVYKRRGQSDAVMIGIGTALADDARLTDRRDGAFLQPIRIVADTHARLPRTSHMVLGIDQAPVWLLCGPDADTTILEKAGVKIIRCPLAGAQIDLSAALKTLGDIGLNDILCEGGATLAANLLQHHLIDEAIIIEGTGTIEGGIPMPALHLQKTKEVKIGSDIWRIYK